MVKKSKKDKEPKKDKVRWYSILDFDEDFFDNLRSSTERGIWIIQIDHITKYVTFDFEPLSDPFCELTKSKDSRTYKDIMTYNLDTQRAYFLIQSNNGKLYSRAGIIDI